MHLHGLLHSQRCHGLPRPIWATGSNAGSVALDCQASQWAHAIAAEPLSDFAGLDAGAQKRLRLGSQTKASLFSSCVCLLPGLM